MKANIITVVGIICLLLLIKKNKVKEDTTEEKVYYVNVKEKKVASYFEVELEKKLASIEKRYEILESIASSNEQKKVFVSEKKAEIKKLIREYKNII